MVFKFQSGHFLLRFTHLQQKKGELPEMAMNSL